MRLFDSLDFIKEIFIVYLILEYSIATIYTKNNIDKKNEKLRITKFNLEQSEKIDDNLLIK